ncbi:MAG: hypothetical protein H7210_01240 [Pyrinomonadaceae bacterium]|nr:hypothetical protein [Phycisphaerales bacterium]
MMCRHACIAWALVCIVLTGGTASAQVTVSGNIDDTYPGYLDGYVATFPGTLQRGLTFHDSRPGTPGYPSRTATVRSGGGPGYVNGYGFVQWIQKASDPNPNPESYGMTTTSSARATWNDIMVTGPAGPAMVPISVNLLLHGSFSFPISNVVDPFDLGWMQYSSAGFSLLINGELAANGNWGVRSDSSGPYLYFGGGVFADFDGTYEGTSAVVMVPANTFFSIEMYLAVTAQFDIPLGGSAIIATVNNFTRTASFATNGPVFNLPAGYTAGSVEAGVTNNTFALCVCDWNYSGGINSQDFFDFLSDFFAADADFNNDALTNSQDFFDFLTCFLTGCP